MKAIEVNFEALPGQTHHYGGHAYGNLASMQHKNLMASPKKAALQSLDKMKIVHDLGIFQAILPPRMRPCFFTLRQFGFRGSDKEILENVVKFNPTLFFALSTSSYMWAANYATVSPSSDTADGKLHFTIANLQSQFHRSIESRETEHLFRQIFHNPSFFTIHSPLPSGGGFGDEGGANHTRFCSNYAEKGFHLFVYSKSAFEKRRHHFPFRQAKEASEAVSRQHGLDPSRVIFVKQNPEMIEAGAFHNDVVSVGNQKLFFYHEHAFVDKQEIIQKLKEIWNIQTFEVPEKLISTKQAIQTYFFNSQLFTLPDDTPLLLAPKECEILDLSWLPFPSQFVNVTESMQNGGGPACQRLRVVMTEEELKQLPPSILFSESLHQKLCAWVETHYRDRLTADDLKDPSLLEEQTKALEQLSDILKLSLL